MRRLGALFFVLAASLVAIGQAQTAPAPTRPAVVTNYNAFTVPLGVPTAGPIIAVPTTGTPVCVAAMNLPFSNTYFTPQGSDDTYVWKPLTGIGGGSIITPGVYVGPDPYRFFRLYFTQSSFPGASGYEACADNSTSLLAPMLNGIDGVLNTYQQLTAIGHPGCAVFDANGFLLPQGGGLPCAGGGGSFVCDAPHSCVTFQTSPSPSPESTDAGGNSFNVAGIGQAGKLITTGGNIESGDGGFLQLCSTDNGTACSASPSETASTWLLEETDGKDGPQQWQITHGPLSVYAAGASFGDQKFFPDQDQFRINYTDMTGDKPALAFQIGDTADANTSFSMGSSTVTASNILMFASNGAGSGDYSVLQISSSIHPGDNNPGISLGPRVFPASIIDGGVGAEADFAGHCTMSSSTTCTHTIAAKYSVPECIATVQGDTPIAGSCKVATDGSGTVTVTAATSNSDDWAFMVFGANE